MNKLLLIWFVPYPFAAHNFNSLCYLSMHDKLYQHKWSFFLMSHKWGREITCGGGEGGERERSYVLHFILTSTSVGKVVTLTSLTLPYPSLACDLWWCNSHMLGRLVKTNYWTVYSTFKKTTTFTINKSIYSIQLNIMLYQSFWC